MLTDENYEDLRIKGYTTVPNVLSNDECDRAILKYREWLSQFKGDDWPTTLHSLIQGYNTGNMTTTWYIRLKARQVFAQIWKTDKLLSSIDAIAVGRPPEDGVEPFYVPNSHWFHVDQGASREGLHAYQGAVYLEAANEDDWTLHIMEGAHQHHAEFFENDIKAAAVSDKNSFYRFDDKEVAFFLKKGCQVKRVAVPKGGIILWDSRLVHANATPLEGRTNLGRWRFCVFVSMTPAIWASELDMTEKRIVYENAYMTTHWSSQHILYFNTDTPDLSPAEVDFPKELPEIAKTMDAKLISGAASYDFNDGQSNGDDYFPKWKGGYPKKYFNLDNKQLLYGLVCFAGVIAAVVFTIFCYRNK